MIEGGPSVAPGELIANRYRIEAWVGQGNMAVVYRAKHIGTGRLCALKLVHPHLAVHKDIVDLFLREAQVGSRIGQSPYIVDVLDAGVDQARSIPFLAMELLQGQTLDALIREAGPIDAATLLILFEQLAEALDQAHAAGVIHRDLKPGNLFLNRDKKGKPWLKVVDFGIAKVLEQEAQRTATQVGSPAYAAPEQLGPTLRRLAERQGITIAQGVSPATDVWALGLIAYELFTGLGGGQYWGQFDTVNDLILRVAFEAEEQPSVRAGPRASLLPPGFDDWFARCLKKNAVERWPSAGEAVQELARLITGTVVENVPTRKLPSFAEINAMLPIPLDLGKRASAPSKPDDPEATDSVTQLWKPPPEETLKLTPAMLQEIPYPAASAPVPPPFAAPLSPVPPAPKPTARPVETQPPTIVTPGPTAPGTRREPFKNSAAFRAAVAALALLVVLGAVLWIIWPRSGSLRIEVRAADGAPIEQVDVYIDGQKRCDRAPCEVTDLLPGARAIKAVTPQLAVAGPANEIVEAGEEKAVTLTLADAKPISTQEPHAGSPPGSPEDQEVSLGNEGGDDPQPAAVPTETTAPQPESPPAASGAPPSSPKVNEKIAFVNVNSIPVTKVLIDGRPIGTTPKLRVPVAPGSHKVQFIHPNLGRKTISVTLSAGETKTVSTRF